MSACNIGIIVYVLHVSVCKDKIECGNHFIRRCLVLGMFFNIIVPVLITQLAYAVPHGLMLYQFVEHIALEAILSLDINNRIDRDVRNGITYRIAVGTLANFAEIRNTCIF